MDLREFELWLARADEEYEILLGSLGYRTDTEGAKKSKRFWLGKLLELYEKNKSVQSRILVEVGKNSR